MLNRRMTKNMENYKNNPSEAKKTCREREKKNHTQDHKVQKGMEEANNDTRKFYTIAHGMRANFQPRMSICKDGNNNLIGNDR
jgi:hypothetical protein